MRQFISSKPKWLVYLIGVFFIFLAGLLSVLPIDLIIATDNSNWLFLYIADVIIYFFTTHYWKLLVKEAHHEI